MADYAILNQKGTDIIPYTDENAVVMDDGRSLKMHLQDLKDADEQLNNTLTGFGENLKTTDWVTLNTTYLTKYRFKNGFVELRTIINNGAIKNVTLGTLPAEFRPKDTLGARNFYTSNDGFIQIALNGNVEMRVSNEKDSGGYFRTNIVFSVD